MRMKGGFRRKLAYIHYKSKEAFRKAEAFRHIHLEGKRGHKHHFVPFKIGRGPIHHRCDNCGKRK